MNESKLIKENTISKILNNFRKKNFSYQDKYNFSPIVHNNYIELLRQIVFHLQGNNTYVLFSKSKNSMAPFEQRL